MAVQTYSGLTNEQRTFYSARLIRRLLPRLPLLRDAQTETIGPNTGAAIQWRKWGSLALATTALTEGTPPSDSSLTVTTVTATLAQYGAVVKVSDLLIRAGIDQAMIQTTDVLAEQAGRSIHTLMVTELGANSSVQYANGRASRVTVAAGDNFTVAEIKKAVRTLENNNVDKFPDGYYHGVITAKQKYDLRQDSAYIDLYRYTNTDALRGNIIGEVEGVRLEVSTDNPVFTAGGAAGIDVHAALIYGPGGYGAVDLSGMNVPNIDPETERGVDVMVVPANTPSKVDPLQQYGVGGWKVAFVAKVIDSARVLRVETAVSP
jgi:N4-gp56 family major capsid protein